MNRGILEILRDPVTFEDLILNGDCIENVDNQKVYRIENEIIRFIENDNIGGDNKKYLELYDKIAPFYNFTNKIYFLIKFGGEKKYRDEFLSELEIRDNDKVLEVSAGSADNFQFLPENINLYGLDISFNMLKQGKKHLKKWGREANLYQGVAESLPFKDESFDIVYHVGGINYFNDKGKAISEMIRVAKSGTKILIVDETEKLVNSIYKKTPITKNYYQDKKDISAPIELIPKEMMDINYKEIHNGLMYYITFRKP